MPPFAHHDLQQQVAAVRQVGIRQAQPALFASRAQEPPAVFLIVQRLGGVETPLPRTEADQLVFHTGRPVERIAKAQRLPCSGHHRRIQRDIPQRSFAAEFLLRLILIKDEVILLRIALHRRGAVRFQ